MKSVLRWLTVLPGALLAMIFSSFPLHFLLYQTLTGSGIVEPYPELPERLLTPLVGAFAFQWAGVRIAPSRKKNKHYSPDYVDDIPSFRSVVRYSKSYNRKHLFGFSIRNAWTG